MIVHKRMFKLKRLTPKNSARDQRGMKDLQKVKRFYNNNESNLGPYFGCGLSGHV